MSDLPDAVTQIAITVHHNPLGSQYGLQVNKLQVSQGGIQLPQPIPLQVVPAEVIAHLAQMILTLATQQPSGPSPLITVN